MAHQYTGGYAKNSVHIHLNLRERFAQAAAMGIVFEPMDVWRAKLPERQAQLEEAGLSVRIVHGFRLFINDGSLCGQELATASAIERALARARGATL